MSTLIFLCKASFLPVLHIFHPNQPASRHDIDTQVGLDFCSGTWLRKFTSLILSFHSDLLVILFNVDLFCGIFAHCGSDLCC
jgi:hypothetical protein